MGAKQPSKTTQVTEVKLPAWVDKASQENYKFAQEVANKPYNPYTGQTVADIGQGTKDAWSMFYNSLGAGNSQRAAAEQIFNQVAGSNAPTVNAKSLTDVDLSKYMNPEIENVVNAAASDADRARVQALMGNADKAVAAGAFGGSRSAIVDAVTNAESIKDLSSLTAKLRSDAFNNAVSSATGDLNRDLAGQQSNATNWLAQMQQRLGAGQGLAGLGNDISSQRDKDVAGLSQIGLQQQQQQQRELDDKKNRFDEAENYDLERLNILLSSLGMSPYGKTETATKTTSGGGGTDWASMGLGIFSILAGLSDRNEKTDIQKVGKDDATGLDLYAYRYKGDPKTYPKVVGPMAQDVEKKFPNHVRKVNGKRIVDMRFLTGAVA